MWKHRLRHNQAASGGDLRAQLQALTEKVKAEPQNQVPLLQLTQLYFQIWTKTFQAEILGRLIQCLKRAVVMEQGRYAAQLRKMIQILVQKTDERDLHSAQGELETILHQLDQLFPPDGTAPQTEKPAQAPPAPPAPPSEKKVEPETRPKPKPEPETQVEPDIEIQTSEDGEAPPEPEAPAPPKPQPDFEIATDEPEPEKVPQPQAHSDTNEADKQALAQLVGQVKQAFAAEDINTILSLYTDIEEASLKRQVVDGFLKRLENWGIAPLLAVGAVEEDESVFRYLTRGLLKRDREAVCAMIHLADYSPELRQVGVTVLSELGVSSALPKLAEALKGDDPIVRAVALHGIARQGARAGKYVPTIIEIASSEKEKPPLRQAAARAIASMNSKSAYKALEKKSRETELPAETLTELEAMRQKFEEAERQKDREEKRQSADAEKQPGKSADIGKIVTFVVVGLALAGVFFFYLLPRLQYYLG